MFNRLKRRVADVRLSGRARWVGAAALCIAGAALAAASPIFDDLPSGYILPTFVLAATFFGQSVWRVDTGYGFTAWYESFYEFTLVAGLLLLPAGWVMVAMMVGCNLGLWALPEINVNRWLLNNGYIWLTYVPGVVAVMWLAVDGPLDLPTALAVPVVLVAVVDLAHVFVLGPSTLVAWGEYRPDVVRAYWWNASPRRLSAVVGYLVALAVRVDVSYLLVVAVLVIAFAVLILRAGRVLDLEQGLTRIGAFARSLRRARTPDQAADQLLEATRNFGRIDAQALVGPSQPAEHSQDEDAGLGDDPVPSPGDGGDDSLSWKGTITEPMQAVVKNVSDLVGYQSAGGIPRRVTTDEMLGTMLVDTERSQYLVLTAPRSVRRFEEMWNAARHLANHARVSINLMRQHHQLTMEAEREFDSARTDPVTGLANHYQTLQMIQAALERPRPPSFSPSGMVLSSVGVVVIHLRDWPKYVQVMGVAAGNRLLLGASERLASFVADDDRCLAVTHHARNAFTVLAVAPEDDFLGLAQELERWIRADNRYSVAERDLAIGVAVADRSARAERLLRRGILAAGRSEASGEIEQFRIADVRDLHRRVELQTELRHAIGAGQITSVLQPQIDLSTGEIVGAEILVRWEHERLGTVAPRELVHIAEQSRLIDTLTIAQLEWTVDACSVLVTSGALPVSLNVSPVSVRRREFLDRLVGTANQLGIPLNALTLEVPESAFSLQPDEVMESLRRLTEQGVRVALDNFGVGYSTLSVLDQLSIDEVKVHSMMATMRRRGGDPAPLLGALIDICVDHGLCSVATGLETVQEVELLRELGCDRAQGYVVARPIPASDMPEWFARNHE